MPFNEFEAWETNAVLTAAELNDNVRDNLYFLNDAVENVDVSNASSLTTGTLGAGIYPSGGIVQTKVVVKADASALNSVPRGGVSNNVPDLIVSITPSLGDSKVLVRGDLNISCSGGSDTYVYLYRRIGSGDFAPVDAGRGDEAGVRVRVTASTRTGSEDLSSVSFAVLDSPGTTEEVRYSVRLGHDRDGSATPFVNRTAEDQNSNRVPRSISTLQASEIRP